MSKLLYVLIGLLLSNPSAAISHINLNNAKLITLPEQNLWSALPNRAIPAIPPANLNSLRYLYDQTIKSKQSVIGSSGSYLAKIPLKNITSTENTWYINPVATFVDTGVAFWQPEEGDIQQLNPFSQNENNINPVLMHSQAFSLKLSSGERGYLWIYINAKQYANPLAVKIYSANYFLKHQFFTNTITVSAVSVMLTLGLIALIIYLRSYYNVAIACAGYIGLHGIGWAAAAGLITHLSPSSEFNFTYFGYYLFPVAIAAACQFTKLLFNCSKEYSQLASALNVLAVISLTISVINPLFSFSTVFALAHIIALIWIMTALSIGSKMLSKNDFRAKYYLLGNTLYALALIYYMLGHITHLVEVQHPELFVISALALDCICILLSLAEWLSKTQNEYNRTSYLARIDPLTTSGNRYAFNEKLAALSQNFIIAFIDFDNVKTINDQQGHEAGDRFLADAAQIMATTQQDSKDKIFRTGGDEFVWLFDIKQQQETAAIVAQISKDIAQCEQILKNKGWLTAGISFGISCSEETNTKSECLALADERMYQQKKRKKQMLSAVTS